MTVQRALNILIEEGFLRSRGSRGMEIAAHPPCTCRFGVILPPEHDRGESNYDTLLLSFSDAAKKLVPFTQDNPPGERSPAQPCF